MSALPSNPRRRIPSLNSMLIGFVWVFCGACVILFALQRLAPWSDFNYFGFVIAPWLLIALLISLLVVMILSVRTRRLFRVLPIALAMVLLGSPYAAAFFPRATSATHPTPLRVMSFNAWVSTAGTNLDDIARVIHQENPDIVALQEMEADRTQTLQAKLNALQQGPAYTFMAADTGTEQVIFSRFPIQVLGIERRQSRVLKLQIDTPSGPIQVWSIHAYRTNVLPGRNFLSYRNLAMHREPRQQFGWLADQAHAVSAPLVIMGDFNLPYETTPLQSLGLREAHLEAGKPFDFTFPASQQQQRYINILGRLIPLSLSFRVVRIDHILVNSYWQVQQAHTLSDAAGSDHAPISADLVLRPL